MSQNVIKSLEEMRDNLKAKVDAKTAEYAAGLPEMKALNSINTTIIEITALMPAPEAVEAPAAEEAAPAATAQETIEEDAEFEEAAAAEFEEEKTEIAALDLEASEAPPFAIEPRSTAAKAA